MPALPTVVDGIVKQAFIPSLGKTAPLISGKAKKEKKRRGEAGACGRNTRLDTSHLSRTFLAKHFSC